MRVQSSQLATRQRFSHLAIAAAMLIGAVPLLGFGRGGADEDIRSVLARGADALLAHQGTYENACGAAYGPPAVDVITDTWEWEIGSGQTCWNVGGATAMGLLAAYERTRNPAYLEGARLFGATLRQRYQTIVVDDPEGAEWEDRPISSDVEFLTRLAWDSHDWSFAVLAWNWHRIITDNQSAEQNVDRLVDERHSLSGWDVASQIRAAIDVGQWRYARDMSIHLLDRRADWEGVPLGDYDWTLLSYASLLDAFVRVPSRSPRIKAAIAEFRDLVLNAQSEDGSWQSDPQFTAYAVMGLDAVQMRHGKRREIHKALGLAFELLRDTQMDSGGWGSPEYGEINAEVLVAVAGLHGGELALRQGPGVRDSKAQALSVLRLSAARPALFHAR